MKTSLSSKGQLVLPAEIRRRDRLEAGQEFALERVKKGEYRLVKLQPPPNRGMVDWLLACPVKGYFVPVESDSTASIAGALVGAGPSPRLPRRPRQ